jgi:hypothetical protein
MLGRMMGSRVFSKAGYYSAKGNRQWTEQDEVKALHAT